MSNEVKVSYTPSWLAALPFWAFIVVKVAGTSFAAWSWWWVLLPIVPWIGLVVKHFGL